MAPAGLAILLGIGPTTGAGITRILASPSHGNLAVAVLSRSITADSPLIASLRASAGPGSIILPFQSDTSEASLSKAFEAIRTSAEFKDLPLRLAIWNVKHSHKTPFESETRDRFSSSLETYVGGAMTFSQLAIKWMLAQPSSSSSSSSTTAATTAATASSAEQAELIKRGTVIFTGTLGALRTNTGYGAYGAGRAGVRMLAQSLAREFSSQGIHVVHAIANGGIVDLASTQSPAAETTNTGESGSKEKEEEEEKEEQQNKIKVARGERIRAESVGKLYLQLMRQEVDLWVHELDMRPAAEKF